MLESIKKLRKKLEEDTAGDFVFTTCPEQRGFRAGATIENYEAIADEIEREVAERYMELPLDAEGVPIRVGDVMRNGTVTCIRDAGKGWEIVLDYWGSHQPCVLTHYHKPTVEDVLREFYVLAVRGKEAHAEDVDEGVLAEYAQRLQLREVDE